MTTSTKRQDFLGRWLDNVEPGTSDAKDHVGRAVASGTTDYLGRALSFDNPSAWATATAYNAGDVVKRKTGSNHDAVYVALDAGTSHAATEPTWPALYGTVVDNAGVNQITWQCIHD